MSINEIQARLSTAQSFPIIGPLLISPVKALVSTIQFVAGIALGSLVGVFGALNNSRSDIKDAFELLDMGGSGLQHLAFSIANMLTLGLIGIYYLGSHRSSF